MAQTPLLDLVTMVHLIVLSMWGGVVATEAVIEIYPFRTHDLAEATSRFHYWIDLLVELPLVVAVAATGITAAFLTERLTGTHLVKIAFAAAAVGINLFCIAVVLRRDRQRRAGASPEHLRRASRIVLACFAVGLACAAMAATLGFSLAMARLG
jgi:hypothetical protein